MRYRTFLVEIVVFTLFGLLLLRRYYAIFKSFD